VARFTRSATGSEKPEVSLGPPTARVASDDRRGTDRFRLVIATARYPPLMGGIEIHVEEVCRRLAARGTDVTVLTTDCSGDLPKIEQRDGVEIARFRPWPLHEDLYFSPAIYARIAKGEWDVLHVQGAQTLVAPTAMLAAARVGLPYVVTFHTGGHSSRLRQALVPVQEAALRPLLARAERLIELTASQARERARRLRLPFGRFVVIPNGSDLPMPSTNADVGQPGLLGSIGRLERYKGHDRVIAAMPFVIKRRPDARLWIGGSGPYEPVLRRLIDDLGLGDRVEIESVPVRERTRMADRLARVHVIVSMSEYESHGIAVLEALGAGCRGVVADAPGLSDLLEQDLARGVPLDSSPEALAGVLLEELERPRVENPPPLPTWDDCARDLATLYEDVFLSRRSKSAAR
jgi:glycosyltransferase involved in cell wall biosynthesis